MSREIEEAEYDVIDRATGEVVSGSTALAIRTERPALPTFASGAFMEIVHNLVSDEAIEAQRAMSKAYDRACDALLSENDYQEEGGKKFKKKSAWRKLGRTFGTSTEIIAQEGRWMIAFDEYLGRDHRHYLASVTVRATAPWGQVMEQVGLCSTRESRFYSNGPACPVCGGGMWDNRNSDKGEKDFRCRNRKSCPGILRPGEYGPEDLGRIPNRTARGKAEHDCTATAVTRATNRAISDLIAAGEVSAEEIEGGDESSYQDGRGTKRSSTQRSSGGGSGAPDVASEAQVRFIWNLMKSHTVSEFKRREVLVKVFGPSENMDAALGLLEAKEDLPSTHPDIIATKRVASDVLEELQLIVGTEKKGGASEEGVVWNEGEREQAGLPLGDTPPARGRGARSPQEHGR